jgi:hypothetical protein
VRFEWDEGKNRLNREKHELPLQIPVKSSSSRCLSDWTSGRIMASLAGLRWEI